MYTLALILTAIGGLNWGLIALFDFNLVAAIFGFDTIATNVIYGLVGVSALYLLISYAVRASTTEARPRRREDYDRRPATAHR